MQQGKKQEEKGIIAGSVILGRVQGVVVAVRQQMGQDVVVHGKQFAIAFIKMLAFVNMFSQLLPALFNRDSPVLRELHEQLLHRCWRAAQAKCDQNFAAPLGAPAHLVHPFNNLSIQRINLLTVALQQVLVKIQHDGLQLLVISAVALYIQLQHLQQLLAFVHTSLPR